MFIKVATEVFYTFGAYKYFAFSIQDKFLQIVANSLGKAKIFHVRIYLNAHLFAHPEIMLYCSLTCKYYSSEFIGPDACFPEFFFRDRLNLIKGYKINLKVIFFFYHCIGRVLRFRLRDQYRFDLFVFFSRGFSSSTHSNRLIQIHLNYNLLNTNAIQNLL